MTVALSDDRTRVIFQTVLVFVALFCFMTWPGSSESYELVSQWGSSGTGDGQFNNPTGIAVDASSNAYVYVTDSGNNRIQKFSSTNTYISQWGSSGTGDGQFNNPTGIAVDALGIAYVTDSGNNRIQKFNSTGTYITQWGSIGTGNGQFNNPTGIAVDASGNAYVTDSGNNRIQKFNSIGTYITQWGSFGNGNGQFNNPTGIALDASGNAYVTDSGNNRIQKFNSIGTYITQWGSAGAGNGQFNNPTGIAVDASGNANIYVIDNGNNRIQKFSPSGAFILKWGSPGSGDGQFNFPYGLAVIRSGNVYVADTNNYRIQKFAPNSINPQVSVSPASGPQGTTFSEPGSGFTPNGSANLYFSGPDGPSTVLNKTILADGTYQHSWTCDACPVGTYAYYAVDNSTGVVGNTVTFSVTEPGLANFVPLYRLYKGGTVKDHFYTIDAAERDDAVNNHGFVFERVEGFVSSVAFTNSVPLYRLYHASNDVHFYATNASEKDLKVSDGYILENTYYIYPTQSEWTSPLYYAVHSDNTDNFYTTSWYEYWNATRTGGWGFAPNGIIGYVSTRIANNRPQGNIAGVGMAVGNFSPPAFTDLSLKGVGPQLSFTRYYDSFSPGTSLGQGWSFNYDSYIQEDMSGGIHVEWGNGSESHFDRIDSTFVPYPGYFEKAVKDEDAMNYDYRITTKDQTVYEFRRLSVEGTGPNILLNKITDRFGNSLSLNRQASYGLVMGATDATGRVFNYEYNPVTITDGRTVQRLTKVTTHLTDTTLVPNREINLAYNAQGNLDSVTDARNNTTYYTYNTNGLLTGITYPEGNTVAVIYNNLLQVTGYKNGIISLSFSYQGGETGTTVRRGINTLFNVLPDSQYRAGRVTFANNTSDTIEPTYCPGNQLNLQCSVKDRNGYFSYFTYDANGNVLTMSNPMSETTTFTYDTKNNLRTTKDPLNNITIYNYDGANIKLESVQKPLGGTTTYTNYTPSGLVGAVTDPTGYRISYTYDANGNVIGIEDNVLPTYMEFTNDGAGRRKTQSDRRRPTPQVTTWWYDNNDNMTSVQLAGHPAAIFEYNKNNLLTKVTDPLSNATTNTYNGMNLLATQQSPDLKTWQYTYNGVGKLASVILPDGNTLAYDYYPDTRLQYVRRNGVEKLYYTYDANGNVLSVRSDGANTTGFTYDQANRIITETDPFGNAIAYGYDLNGNRTNITYPDNKVVKYTFDDDNRLWKVKDWLGNAETVYTYNTAGILQSIANANGTSTTFSYDLANRLTGLANKRSNNNIITSYGLTLDLMGNPTSIDRNEPLLPPVPTDSDTIYSYDKANQILSAGSTTFTHDGLGNLSGASDGRSLTFDYANRLASATIGGISYSFLYDAFGNRLSRTRGGVQTRYLQDLNDSMNQVLAEMDSSNNVQNYYVYGLGLISRITPAGVRSTYHFDQVGNTVAITDDSGTVTDSYTYDEFGAVLASSGAGVNPFRYVGKYGVMDEGNGLLNMRARYYDTQIGRFLSRDPLGFEGGDLNLYAYVGGNPLVGIDPEGLVCGTGGSDSLVPDYMTNNGKIIFDFTQACTKHDKNYGDPNMGWHDSNRIFLNDMNDWCDKFSDDVSQCKQYAKVYFEAVESNKGLTAYNNANSSHKETGVVIITYNNKVPGSTPATLPQKPKNLLTVIGTNIGKSAKGIFKKFIGTAGD